MARRFLGLTFLLLALSGCSLGQAIDDVHVISETLVRTTETLERSNTTLIKMGTRLDHSNTLLVKATTTLGQMGPRLDHSNKLLVKATKSIEHVHLSLKEMLATSLKKVEETNRLMASSVKGLLETNRLLAAAQTEMKKSTEQIKVTNGQIKLTNERVKLIKGTNEALAEVNVNLMNLETTNEILKGMQGKVGQIDHTNGQLSLVLYILIGTVIALGVAALGLIFLYGKLPRELAKFLELEIHEVQKLLGIKAGEVETVKMDPAEAVPARRVSGRFSSRRVEGLAGESDRLPRQGGEVK